MLLVIIKSKNLGITLVLWEPEPWIGPVTEPVQSFTHSLTAAKSLKF